MIRVSNEMDLCLEHMGEHRLFLNTSLRKLIQWVHSEVNTDLVGLTLSDRNGHTR